MEDGGWLSLLHEVGPKDVSHRCRREADHSWDAWLRSPRLPPHFPTSLVTMGLVVCRVTTRRVHRQAKNARRKPCRTFPCARGLRR